MDITVNCEFCGAALTERASACSRCQHPAPPSIVDQMQLAVVERFATTARWALIATVPPVLVALWLEFADVAAMALTLNLLALQGFVLLYFNGRVAEARRSRLPSAPGPAGSWLAPKFDRDLAAVLVSVVLALMGYLALLKVLTSAPG